MVLELLAIHNECVLASATKHGASSYQLLRTDPSASALAWLGAWLRLRLRLRLGFFCAVRLLLACTRTSTTGAGRQAAS